MDRRCGWVAGAVLVLLAATGCAAPTEPAADSPDASSFATGAPESEVTGATEGAAGDAGEGEVAVELPGLPIGGTASVVSPSLQCVDVGWTAPPDLPGWMGIDVTGVAFQPPGGFTLSSESCAGAPACLADGFRLTVDGPRCVVAVAWTGAAFEEEGSMSFSSGRLVCPAERVPECEAFRDAVATEGPQSIPLEPPPTAPETDGTETGGTETDGTETDGAESPPPESEGAPTDGTEPDVTESSPATDGSG
jgi:hypothetical protein